MKYKNKPEDSEDKNSQDFLDIIDRLQDWNEDNIEQSVKTKTMLKEEMESLVAQYKEGNSFAKKVVANRLKDINTQLKNVSTNMQGDKKLFTASTEQILKEMNKSQSNLSRFNKGLIETMAGEGKSEFGRAFMDNINPMLKLSIESVTKATKFFFGKSKDEAKQEERLDSILGRFEKNMDASKKKDKTREMKESLDDMNRWSKKYYKSASDSSNKMIESQNAMIRILEDMKNGIAPQDNESNKKKNDDIDSVDSKELLTELQVISRYEYANQILLDRIHDDTFTATEYLDEQLTTLNRIETDIGGLLMRLENTADTTESNHSEVKKPADVGLGSDTSGQLGQISEYLSYIGEILLDGFKKLEDKPVGGAGKNSDDLVSLYGDIQGEDFSKVQLLLNSIDKSIMQDTEYSNEIWDVVKETNNKLERLIDITKEHNGLQQRMFMDMNGNLLSLNEKTDEANQVRKEAEIARQKESLEATERHNELMAQNLKNSAPATVAPVANAAPSEDGKGGILNTIMNVGKGYVAKKVAQSVLGRIVPRLGTLLPSLSSMLPSMSTLGSAALGAAPLGLMAYATNEAGDTSKDNSRSSSLLEMAGGLKDKLKDWFGFDKDSEIDAIRKKNRAELGGEDATVIPSNTSVQPADITTAQKQNQVLTDQLNQPKPAASGNGTQVTNLNNINNGVTNVYNNGLSTRNRDTSWSARLLNNGAATS